MAGIPSSRTGAPRAIGASPTLQDPRWVRVLLIGTMLAFLGALLVAPLVVVFGSALSQGLDVFFAALEDEDARAAIRLTLMVAAIAVPANTAFGLCAAWCIGKFRFRGRGLLVTLIDLPFAVSPVVAGLVLVLLFGRHGLLGPVLASQEIKIIFAVPGIVLATAFVTFPFVAREVLPSMEARGTGEEEIAHLMGASGWQTFARVTLPNVRYGLLYGIVLCTARAMGEFGAVSVVSGHIRGQTNTMPLHVEVLYHDYQHAAAFAVASLLALLALASLAAKRAIEWFVARRSDHGGR